MRYLQNDRGVALITSLLLTLICLVIVMSLMYYITLGIQVSAAGKRYKNVVEAGYGGVSLAVNDLIPSMNNAIFNNFSSGLQDLTNRYGTSIGLVISSPNCLRDKLDNATVDWGAACVASNKSLDPKESPDFTFVLHSTPNFGGVANPFVQTEGYRVYSKIVDTPVKGNTDKADRGNLRKGENVTDSSETQAGGRVIPTTYRIEVRAEQAVNPQEKVDLSVLYAF